MPDFAAAGMRNDRGPMWAMPKVDICTGIGTTSVFGSLKSKFVVMTQSAVISGCTAPNGFPLPAWHKPTKWLESDAVLFGH